MDRADREQCICSSGESLRPESTIWNQCDYEVLSGVVDSISSVLMRRHSNAPKLMSRFAARICDE